MVKTAERISSAASADNPVFQRHLIAYYEAKKLVKGSTLEIGCGEGYGIEILADNTENYLAIDKFKAAAFDKYQDHEGVECRQMSVPPLEGIESDSFDTVVSFQVIEHIEDDEKFLEEIRRVLKKGGKAIITTPNKKMSLTRNPWHIREYDPAEMERLVAKYFADYEIKGLYGNEKVMQYYEENKRSVQKITRFDILNLQYLLPRALLKVPYDILNRMNRDKLKEASNGIAAEITSGDYFLDEVSEICLDYFIILNK